MTAGRTATAPGAQAAPRSVVANGDTAYGVVVAGSGAGRPAVLLHGFTGNADDWAPFVPALVAGRTVIALDLLGHGASARPADPARYTLDRQAADVADLVTALATAPAILVGYSYGARIALQVARDHAAAVAGLALVSPSAGIADPAERAARRTSDEALAEDLEREGIDAFVRRWADLPVFAGERRLPPAVREEHDRRRRANDARALAAALRGAGQGAMTPLHDVLAAIRAPVAVLAGALDAAGAARARDVAERIPSATLTILDDAGHAPQREVPDRFRGWLVATLADLDRRSTVPPSPPRRSP